MTKNPMRSRECGAHARTTGRPCRGLAVTGSARCRMHGGKGSGRPPLHGRHTKAAMAERRAAREINRRGRAVMQAIADRLYDKITDEELLAVLAAE